MIKNFTNPTIQHYITLKLSFATFSMSLMYQIYDVFIYLYILPIIAALTQFPEELLKFICN